MREIIVSDHISDLAAEKFVMISNESVAERGQFTVALSGGATPKRLYQSLAGTKYRPLVNWQKIDFFFGDERNVLPVSEDSNYHLAEENLFIPLNIERSQIHRWETEIGDPREVAERYELTIRNHFHGFPRFDLIFLGMGTDGHTASLFPGTRALCETERLAVENWVDKFKTWRFTLTYPTINNARNVIFLVAGQEKSETLNQVLNGELDPEKLPSQSVAPGDGCLLILTDIQQKNSVSSSETES